MDSPWMSVKSSLLFAAAAVVAGGLLASYLAFCRLHDIARTRIEPKTASGAIVATSA